MSPARQLALLATSIFLGVAYPPLAALCKPLLLPLVFLLFTAAIMQIRFGDAAYEAFRSSVCWIILVWQLLLLPLAGALLLSTVLSGELYVFAVVSLCTCAITATTALARLLELNDALSMVVGLIGSLLMPLPLYVCILYLDLPAHLEVSTYLWRVVVFVVMPFVVVYVFRRLASAGVEQRVRDSMPSFVIVLLVLFGLAVMDGVQALLISRPGLIAAYVALSFALSLAVQLITYFALLACGHKNSMTAALLCAYRNLGVIAALTGSALGEHFLIFVGIWQIPMYTLPILLRRIYTAPVALSGSGPGKT